MPDSRKSSSTTALSAPKTTEFGPWNNGIASWRMQKREARTLLVEQFLTQHGSTRLCSGPVTYTSKIRFSCAKCGREASSRWKDLLNRDRIWCKSCAAAARMVGVVPSQAMRDAAARANAAATTARQARWQVQTTPVPLEKRSTKAQVKVLSQKWPAEEWAKAMKVAIGAHQRCLNPGATQFRYYGGRGIEFRFLSTAFMADWLLVNLGPRPANASIDRIDFNGHYEPGNLRWATKVEQSRNRSSCRLGT